MTTAHLDRIAGYDSETRNDQRFDGQFFSAVMTTGIFCRPGCPGRPRAENVRFFTTAAAAAEAGYRPCLRCHPESAPDPPEWHDASPIVSRALRLIGEGLLDDGTMADLADRLCVSQRQLQRLFVEDLGAPPVAVAQTRRLLFAKKLIDETDLSMTEIAFSAGYSSVRRFNEAMKQTYARTPTELRAMRRRLNADPDSATIELKLFYRDPYNWPAMLTFLAEHATPLVESVERNSYRRTIRIGDEVGIISIRPLANHRALLLRVTSNLSRYLMPITERVKQMFDLRADPVAIAESLSYDADLEPLIVTQAGVRLPGCWDGFEVAIRATIESQAPGRDRELVQALVQAFGVEMTCFADLDLTNLFPTAERLSVAHLEAIGISNELADTIRALSTAVVEGALRFSTASNLRCLTDQLAAVPGIDQDAISYTALRVLGEPDLDLIDNPLLFGPESAESRDQSRYQLGEPLRSYAAMYRWAGNRPLMAFPA